jgi:uncharacterized protein YndB with AHSA1/START domain
MTTHPATDRATSQVQGNSMSDIRIVRDYPHPPSKVWRALTDPELIALWGMRPEGFAPVVGTRFKFVAKPNPGWRGFVECEVLEVREPSLLRYAWVGDDSGKATYVTFSLAAHAGGTRLTFQHSGFTGVGGFMLAKLMMGPGWKKMLGDAFPAVLADLDDAGKLRPGSSLKPKF